jgi:O-antigen/teichoic acid export membrane protein
MPLSAEEILKYGFPIVISNILIILLSIFDRFVINAIMGEESLAKYSANYEFTEKIFFFINSWFTLATSKQIFEYYDVGNEFEISTIITNVMSLYIKIVLPIGFLYIQLLDDISQILFTNFYSDKSEVGIYIALSAMLIGIMHRYTIILSALKKTLEIAKATATAVIVNIILSIFFVKNFGLIGAAWATLISSITWLIMVRIYLVDMKIPLFPWKELIKVIICIIFATLILRYITQFYMNDCENILLIINSIFIYVASYIIFIKIIKKLEIMKLI